MAGHTAGSGANQRTSGTMGQHSTKYRTADAANDGALGLVKVSAAACLGGAGTDSRTHQGERGKSNGRAKHGYIL